MVVIRLARGGSKKKPFYHVVAADKRSPRDGRNIEQLGFYNPVAQGQATRLELNKERLDYWLNTGAQPSERVASLIKQFDKGLTAAVVREKPEHKQPVKKAEKAEDSEAPAEAPAEDAQAPAAEADSDDSK